MNKKYLIILVAIVAIITTGGITVFVVQDNVQDFESIKKEIIKDIARMTMEVEDSFVSCNPCPSEQEGSEFP